MWWWEIRGELQSCCLHPGLGCWSAPMWNRFSACSEPGIWTRTVALEDSAGLKRKCLEFEVNTINWSHFDRSILSSSTGTFTERFISPEYVWDVFQRNSYGYCVSFSQHLNNDERNSKAEYRKDQQTNSRPFVNKNDRLNLLSFRVCYFFIFKRIQNHKNLTV